MSYQDVVRNDNPIVFWPFDTGTTSDLTDEIAGLTFTNHNGAVLGGKELYDNGGGKAVEFDGTTNGARLECDPSSVAPQIRALEMVVQWYGRAPNNGWEMAFTYGGRGNTYRPYIARAYDSGSISDQHLAAYNGATGVQLRGTLIDDLVTHHIVVQYDPDSAASELYIDGALDTATSGDYFQDGGTAFSRFFLGTGIWDGAPLHWMWGGIAGVAFYDAPLTQSQIQAHSDARFATYALSGPAGAIKDDAGNAAQRTVRVYRRSNGTKIGETVSNADGSWDLVTPYEDTVEHDVVVLDDDAGTQYRDIIIPRVTPVQQ